MRKRRHKLVNPVLRPSIESGEFIPLVEWLRLNRVSRRTFYNHPEIPRVKDGYHVYIPRAYEVQK